MKTLMGQTPLATQSGLVVLVFFNSLQAAFYPFLGHLRTLRRSKMPEEDLLMRSTQAKTIAAASRFKAVRV